MVSITSMDVSFRSIGVQPKSSYVQHGGIRGIPDASEDPNKEYIKAKNPTVELYAERWAQGLNIWTGKPLEGDALADWEQQQKRERGYNQNNAKRAHVARAIEAVGVVRRTVRAYCEEHFQFSPSSNLISEMVSISSQSES